MSYYPKIELKDDATVEEKLEAIINILNNLSREMSIGRVPNNKEELQENINATKNELNIPLSIAFVKMAEKGDIDEITASEHIEMFLPWDDKSTFEIGSLRTRAFEDEGIKLYQCLQAHTGQIGWKPENTPALWKELVISKDGIPYWSQPISTADSYMMNNEVINPKDNLVYVSDYDNNVWEPGTFGWHIHIKEVAE